MPGGDGTGPMGFGPMTGRAAGYCAGYPVPGFMNPVPGRAFLGRGYAPYAQGYAAPQYGAAYSPAPYGAPYAPAFGFGRGRGWGRGRGRGFGWGRGRGWGRAARWGFGPAW